MSFHRAQEHDFTALLEGATTDQLQQLMDNEDKINEIVCDQEKIKQMKLDKELLQAENRSIADHNLSREPKLNQLRQTLAEKYENLKELNDTFQTNQAKMASLHKDVNLETMFAVLQTTCAEAEEMSEKLAEKLFDGELSIGDFITSFKAKRTEAHMRRIKMEKMREFVLEAHRNPSSITPPVPPRVPVAAPRQAPAYPGSTSSQPTSMGSFPSSYAPPTTTPPRYPTNAFTQPPAQQYPTYNW